MTNNVTITPIRSHSILTHWGSVEPLLQRVLDKIDSGYSKDDVFNCLIQQEMQLWVVNDWQAIAITEVVNTPQFRKLSIIYLAGDGVADWFNDLKLVLHPFAEDLGCKYIEVTGRLGWLKVLKQYQDPTIDETLFTQRFNLDERRRGQ